MFSSNIFVSKSYRSVLQCTERIQLNVKISQYMKNYTQAPDDIFNWREIGNYSVCGFHVDLKRRSFKFIFNNYIPCALFVLVSWVSFLIPPDLIPGR